MFSQAHANDPIKIPQKQVSSPIIASRLSHFPSGQKNKALDNAAS